MNGLWTSFLTGVCATALLALSAGAAMAGPNAAGAAAEPFAFTSAHPTVTVEFADATRAPMGTVLVGVANPASARYFAFASDDSRLSGHMLEAPPLALALDTAPQIALSDVVVSRDIAPFASVEFAYGQRADAFALPDIGEYLRNEAWSSPYASLADGGAYTGMRLRLGDDLSLRFGVAARDSLRFTTGTPISPMPADLLASAGDGISAQSVSAGLDWQITDWASLGVTASQTNERGTILGRTLSGPIAVSNGANTTALSVSARVGFGDGWVTTVAFDEGVTQLDLKPVWSMPGGSLYSQSYGLAIAKQGLFGDDMLGFSISRPLQANGITFGQGGFGPQTRLSLSEFTRSDGAPQSDIQLGYVTTFLDGSLALQANAGYRVNANGARGEDAVTARARAAIKF
jgi:hypothetical protein